MALTGSNGSNAPSSGPRRVTILGSTGSIGQNTIDLLQRNRDDFTVEALTANSNAALLAEQMTLDEAIKSLLTRPLRSEG